jgi:hypothetical protein
MTERSRERAPVARREVALFLAVALALRILWMVAVGAWSTPVDLGEASRAVLAFARTGTVADAYFAGQGPTAHFMPTMIAIGGTIERLLGPDSAAANVALSLWALAQVLAGFVLTLALFRRLGAPRRVLLLGLGVLCVVPACIAQEAADFRVWEGALAYDLAAAGLWWMATLTQRRVVATRELVPVAAAVALAFFVNPPAGLATGAAAAVFAGQRLAWRQTARLALMTAAAATLLIAPWALRNRAQFGETVLLRSNFGLELAIANHDGALAPADPRAALTTRMDAVHQTKERFRQAGGELAYSRAVGAEAKRWIGAHPLAFVRLCWRHYRQFYLPDTWEERATNWEGADRFRIRVLQVIGTLGLLGLAAGLARRCRGHAMLAAYLVTVGLPYALVQPIPRYGYLAYPLLVFLAAHLVVEAAAALRRPSSPTGSAVHRVAGLPGAG